MNIYTADYIDLYIYIEKGFTFVTLFEDGHPTRSAVDFCDGVSTGDKHGRCDLPSFAWSDLPG